GGAATDPGPDASLDDAPQATRRIARVRLRHRMGRTVVVDLRLSTQHSFAPHFAHIARQFGPRCRPMSLSSARLRYLSAMGAVLPSLMLVSCKDPAQPPSSDPST